MTNTLRALSLQLLDVGTHSQNHSRSISVKLHIAWWHNQSDRSGFGDPLELNRDLSSSFQFTASSSYRDPEINQLMSHAQIALFDVKTIELEVGKPSDR